MLVSDAIYEFGFLIWAASDLTRDNFVGHWPEKPANFHNVMTSLTTSCILFFLVPQGTLKMIKNLFIAGCSGIS